MRFFLAFLPSLFFLGNPDSVLEFNFGKKPSKEIFEEQLKKDGLFYKKDKVVLRIGFPFRKNVRCISYQTKADFLKNELYAVTIDPFGSTVTFEKALKEVEKSMVELKIKPQKKVGEKMNQLKNLKPPTATVFVTCLYDYKIGIVYNLIPSKQNGELTYRLFIQFLELEPWDVYSDIDTDYWTELNKKMKEK